MNKYFTIILIISFFKTEAQTSVLNIADSLFANGNYSKAIETYKTYDSLQVVYDKIASAYLAVGNYDKALTYYKKCIISNPENILVKFQYAKLLSKTKNFEEAKSVFHQLIVIDSLNPTYHYELGLVYENLHDSLDIYTFKRTFLLDKTHQKAIYKIAKHYLQKRKHDSVKKYLDIGLNSYENNVELISLKAQNNYWQKKYLESSFYFEKLISLGENSQFIYEKLSYCYSELSEIHKAITHQKLAINFEPQNATNIYILGTLYERISDYKNAENCIKQSLEIQDIPLDSEYRKLGTILNQQKKYKEAINAFNHALQEKPNDPITSFYLIYTKDKYYQDVDMRIVLYQNYKKEYPNSPMLPIVKKRLSELQQEKFLKTD